MPKRTVRWARRTCSRPMSRSLMGMNSSVPVRATGTMGTPARLAMSEAPFLAWVRAPVRLRPPSGKMRTEWPALSDSTARLMGSMSEELGRMKMVSTASVPSRVITVPCSLMPARKYTLRGRRARSSVKPSALDRWLQMKRQGSLGMFSRPMTSSVVRRLQTVSISLRTAARRGRAGRTESSAKTLWITAGFPLAPRAESPFVRTSARGGPFQRREGVGSRQPGGRGACESLRPGRNRNTVRRAFVRQARSYARQPP